MACPQLQLSVPAGHLSLILSPAQPLATHFTLTENQPFPRSPSRVTQRALGSRLCQEAVMVFPSLATCEARGQTPSPTSKPQHPFINLWVSRPPIQTRQASHFWQWNSFSFLSKTIITTTIDLIEFSGWHLQQRSSSEQAVFRTSSLQLCPYGWLT